MSNIGVFSKSVSSNELLANMMKLGFLNYFEVIEMDLCFFEKIEDVFKQRKKEERINFARQAWINQAAKACDKKGEYIYKNFPDFYYKVTGEKLLDNQEADRTQLSAKEERIKQIQQSRNKIWKI